MTEKHHIDPCTCGCAYLREELEKADAEIVALKDIVTEYGQGPIGKECWCDEYETAKEEGHEAWCKKVRAIMRKL